MIGAQPRLSSAPLFPTSGERGVALLATMGIVLALLPLTMAVMIETQLDLLMQRNARSSVDAFYAAEAGLAHARAELRPSASFEALLDGPDGSAGTADDGIFPFRLAVPSSLTRPSSSYEVFAYRGSGGTIRLHSRGYGHNGAIGELEAIVTTNPTPFTPGALYVETSSVDIRLGSLGFAISGMPAHGGDVDAIAGIAVPSSNTVEALRSSIPRGDAVVGTGPSPSVLATSPIGIVSYADSLENHADAVQISASERGPLTLGTEASPQLTIVLGDWTTTGLINGFGILLIRGDLEVRDRVEYRGLLIVEGKIELGSSSDVQIEGATWCVDGAVSRLRLTGAGFFHYGPQVLAQVDAAIPNALLHVPVVVAWRQVS